MARGDRLRRIRFPKKKNPRARRPVDTPGISGPTGPPLRLRHMHLPSKHPYYIPYSLANRVQEHLRRQHLDFKDGSANTPPPPTLISFTPSPIYTFGRRQTTPLTTPEIDRLTAPLQIALPKPTAIPVQPKNPQHRKLPADNSDSETDTYQDPYAPISVRPHVLHSPRGGLTTYHGPGQAVLWPVLDLKSPLHRHFSVRCYARLLETTTIETLRGLFGVEAFTSEEEPGVWVASGGSSSSSPPLESQAQPQSQDPPKEDEGKGKGAAEGASKAAEATTPTPTTTPRSKIAALGVHLRRHITALGTAINVSTPPSAPSSSRKNDQAKEEAEEEETSNPWTRFTPCGIAEHGVTSIAREILATRARTATTTTTTNARPLKWADRAPAFTTPAKQRSLAARQALPASLDGLREVDDDLAAYGRLGSAGLALGAFASRESLVASAWAGVLAGQAGLGLGLGLLGEGQGERAVEVVEGAKVLRLMEELVVEAAERGEGVADELVYLEGVREVVGGRKGRGEQRWRKRYLERVAAVVVGGGGRLDLRGR